jgi:DNA-binding NarL/FixJ family response regulator
VVEIIKKQQGNDMNSIVIIEDHPVMRKGLASYFAETGRWHLMIIPTS